MNSNVVSLIPKIPGADSIKDYRPIAVANFKFKIISKILADMLALVTSGYGFVPGRQIQDCIGIASEPCFLKRLEEVMWLTKLIFIKLLTL